MKTTQYVSSIVLILSLLLSTTQAVNAQKKNSRMRVYYEKLSDNSKKISAILIKGKGKDMTSVENAEVFLSTFDGEEEIPLTTVFTDANGEADLYVEEGYRFPVDEEGTVTVMAVYNGCDSIKSSDKDVTFKDVHLEVSLEVVDSVKTITVKAFELSPEGEPMPAAEIDLKVGVQRLHSILYLEEGETDEDGMAEIHFPDDIPGDGSGNISIVIKISEDKVYGTVTKTIVKDWGLVVDFSEATNGRSLFGDEAPLWMIISVFIILLGAWFHFLFAIYQVFRMSKTNKYLV